ncbi:hypothetical protein BT96DRAFT_836342, partial [Gymnopus androsaceus JB14]
RPEAVQWWSRNAKPAKRIPPEGVLGSVQDFRSCWWRWWSVINPDWREHDAEGRIVVGGDGNGNWAVFKRPGQCGMLTVLNCLSWWWSGLGASEERLSLWNEGLKDVAWVIGELVAANRWVSWFYYRVDFR